MRTALRFLPVVSFLCLLFSLPVSLFADNTDSLGVINGSLVNGTVDKRAPGVQVILKRYGRDQEKENQKTLSDPHGRFYFRRLDPGEGQTYIIQTVYKGVEYYSPSIVFKDQKREIPVVMTVYDTTDSDTKISIAMHHVLVETKDNSLRVRELLIVQNEDNRVYVGAHEIESNKKETLRISLPPNAQELQLLRDLKGCCIVRMQDGLAYTMGIKPGKTEIGFAYTLDYSAPSLILPKRINLMTDSLDFFIPKGIHAKGENIQYVGLIGENGKQQFLHFSGKKLAKGSQVALNIEGLPKVKRFVRAKKLLRRIAPTLGAALLAFGLLYPLIRRRKTSSKTEEETGQETGGKSKPQDEREKILRDIAQLDDQLDSGEISPEEHDKKRSVLKKRAIELTQSLRL